MSIALKTAKNHGTVCKAYAHCNGLCVSEPQKCRKRHNPVPAFFKLRRVGTTRRVSVHVLPVVCSAVYTARRCLHRLRLFESSSPYQHYGS